MMDFCHLSKSSSALIYYLFIISSLSTSSQAFLSIPTSPRTNHHCPPPLLSTRIAIDEISRRELLESTTKVAGAISAASFIEPAHATTATQVISKSLLSASLCDPSVSSWTKNYGTTLRTVHILGTAHISSASAELAGRLVREVKPNVVFVELDVKRVKRAIPGLSSGDPESSSNNNNPSEDATKSKIAAFTATPSPSNESNSSPIIDIGSKYVGDAVKNMYGKLESEGFKAGDEFAMSVREGLANGSTIVLGDRDVEVTLRRLTKALAKTDIRKLLSADSEVERSMEELLPENLKEQMLKKGRGGGGGGVAVEVGKMVDQAESSMGMDVQVNKAEFQSFVETMKEKDNVKKIMAALQKTAPEIYEAMVAERDLYMAKGLDELGDNLKSDVGDTVAVMGMAHVDGVERYLSSQGWEEKRYPCPVVR